MLEKEILDVFKQDSTVKLKTERIGIRLTSQDLKNIKQIAEKEGLRYQTLISSVLHKYIMDYRWNL